MHNDGNHDWVKVHTWITQLLSLYESMRQILKNSQMPVQTQEIDSAVFAVVINTHHRKKAVLKCNQLGVKICLEM